MWLHGMFGLGCCALVAVCTHCIPIECDCILSWIYVLIGLFAIFGVGEAPFFYFGLKSVTLVFDILFSVSVCTLAGKHIFFYVHPGYMCSLACR